jgi:hypothetical protein
MQLTTDDCWIRLGEADHGILCTTNASGAIDAVPTCLAVVGARLATPIDTVKPKRTTNLARRTNLDRDAAATLLCEHWDRDDWSRLWWVKARLARLPDLVVDDQLRSDGAAVLREKYPQYRDEDFADVLVFDVVRTSGWSAGG